MMKEIKNWEAIYRDENGNEGIGILVPGCIVKGIVKDDNFKVEAIDVDTSNLTIVGADGQKYLLTDINREYLNNISQCIEYEKNERDGEER